MMTPSIKMKAMSQKRADIDIDGSPRKIGTSELNDKMVRKAGSLSAI